MSNNLRNNLAQEMFSKGQLNCSHCHGLLRVPIILVDGGAGNMCGECFEAINDKKILKEDEEVKLKGVQNNLLNDLVKTLELPCKFRPSGCSSVIKYDAKSTHEKNCSYQPHDCLNTRCVWKGSTLQLIKHFTENHAMHVVEMQNNKFRFGLSLAECDIPFVKLLKSQNICLFFTGCVKDEKMFYKVFDAKNNGKPPYEYVKISHLGPKNKLTLKCKVGTFKDHIKSSVQQSEVNWSLLPQFTVANNVVTMQIKNVSTNICIVSKKISHHFECPVCKKLMFSTIQMCESGHSFCGECRLELKSCPICQGYMQDSRNFSLEHLSADVLHPCHYKCGESFLGSKLQDHMKHCVRKTFKCPLDTFVGFYDALENHFKTMHVKNSIFSNAWVWQITLRDDRKYSQNTYMFYRNNLFVSELRQTYRKFTWVVRDINSFVKKYNFIYEISIISPKNESHKLTMSAYCPLNEKADPNCVIKLHYNTLIKYTDDQDKIKITCNIKAVDFK